MSTVAACIIGNEVLNGKTLDTNSHHLAKKCFEVGLRLQQIRVIPDNIETISSTIRELSEQYELVFTSGGIGILPYLHPLPLPLMAGPTHDDMTYEAIAKAFSLPLLTHQPTLEAMARMRIAGEGGGELNEGQRRMALIPQPDEVTTTPGLWVPLVKVRNVLILPGVPRLFHVMLDHWMQKELPTLSNIHQRPMYRKLLRTQLLESVLAARLTHLQQMVQERGIELGSYPKLLSDGTTHVVLSLVGPMEETRLMEETAERIAQELDATPIDADE